MTASHFLVAKLTVYIPSKHQAPPLNFTKHEDNMTWAQSSN